MCTSSGSRGSNACSALCVMFAFGGLNGQTPAWQSSPGHTQVPIWQGAVPDAQPVVGSEVATPSSGKDGLIACRPVVGVSKVARPTMTVFMLYRASCQLLEVVSQFLDAFDWHRPEHTPNFCQNATILPFSI
jgi:hypothetical protein